MSTVKYKNGEYSVNFIDKIKIDIIKIWLDLKRWIRRLFVLIPQNKGFYIILIIAWIIFGIITYFWGKEYYQPFYLGDVYITPEPYTWKDVLWDLKTPCFTSLVLSVIIDGYSQSNGYRNKLKDQHEFYVETMRVFDYLFEPLLGDEIYDYMPFYNDKCIEDTLDYVKKDNLWEIGDKDSLIENLNNIVEQFDELEEEIRQNNFLYINTKELNDAIKEARNTIKISIQNNLELNNNDIKYLVDTLFTIVDDIRVIWRKDEKNNNQILKILAKYDVNKISEDFYYSMHLYGHKFQTKNGE